MEKDYFGDSEKLLCFKCNCFQFQEPTCVAIIKPNNKGKSYRYFMFLCDLLMSNVYC